MTCTADTIRLITQGEYSVGTSGTITSADFATYLLWAEAQFSIDNPGNATDSLADLAVGLLICHYIDRAKTDQNIKSEDAGDGATTYGESGSNWMKSYQSLISSLQDKITRDQAGAGVSQQPSRGVVRTDSTRFTGFMPSSQG